MGLPQLPSLQKACLHKQKIFRGEREDGKGDITGVFCNFELVFPMFFPLLPEDLAFGLLGICERGVLATLHIRCLPRNEYSCGLSFLEQLEELTDARDGFFCDTVNILANRADVREWWPRCE